MKLPRVIAHRGASRYAPENTLAAFQKAHEMGASWVETDVRLTKDHVPILLHDDSLKRTTGVDALAQASTFAEIEQCHAGNEKIPTLLALLEFLKKNNMGLNLELKPALQMEVDTARIAMQTVIDHGFPKENILISSFSLIALEAAYQHAPGYHYGWLSDNDRNMEIGLASTIPFVSMHINQDRASQLLVTTLKNRGYFVLCYTVNDKQRADALFKMGVNAVFSDEPNLI